jgi:hypothetical protein
MLLKANRNKKSVRVFVKHAKGVEILHKLAAESDVVVENYLPATSPRHQLDYAKFNGLKDTREHEQGKILSTGLCHAVPTSMDS